VCGINGIISNDKNIKSMIQNMNNLIRHRGPDDEGYVCVNSTDGNCKTYAGDDTIDSLKRKLPHISLEKFDTFDVVFGTRRLSIIDLTENGHQPMSDERRKLWITYNGEIYNYIELRKELQGYGYKFTTGSDTEVIINSYLKWGIDCVNHLNGMWAFGLWDGWGKKVILARDRFGVKPLYYTYSNKYFAFSSEIKPLILLNGYKFEVNFNKIPFFILYGNRLNHKDTYIKNIYTVKAANVLIYDMGSIVLNKYYDVKNKDYSNKNEKELSAELLELLNDSIKLRYRSDVPVGTCLSGGFDSSSIVSISSEIGKKKLNTFSAVWERPEYARYDESKYIDIVNRKFNCIENKIEPKAEEFEKVFEELNYYQELPSEGPGLIPQWYVMKKAKGKVKVLLDGQGGDELFGGYFLAQTYLRSLIKDRQYIQLLAEIKLLSKYLNKREMHSFSIWLFPRFYNRIVRTYLSEQFGILRSDVRKNIKRQELYYDSQVQKKYKHYLNNLSYHFITQLTIPTLLHYEDRSSMAHSIESRVPFLDYRLVEFGINLPPKYLIHKNTPRPLFRKALQDHLPKEIVERREKLGYPAPFAEWSRQNLKSMILDTLLSKSCLDDFINTTFLEKKLQNHFEGKIDYSWDIWRLMSLRKFLTLPAAVKMNSNNSKN
jgi:asparagine synthase (glutamine-hydrolysing)